MTTKHTLMVSWGLLFIALFSSCYSPRYVYSPAVQHIPRVSKKGDITGGAYLATGGGTPEFSEAVA